VRGGLRAGRQEARRASAVCTQRAGERGCNSRYREQGAGSTALEQRTLNMRFMSVTREVSQSEMSALKLPLSWKSSLMSVTPETHQPAMAPYFISAASAFESYSPTAVCREALSTKS
jgi:hypothetical protein